MQLFTEMTASESEGLTRVCVYVCRCVCVYMCVYVCICICVCVCVYVYVYVYVYVCVCALLGGASTRLSSKQKQTKIETPQENRERLHTSGR